MRKRAIASVVLSNLAFPELSERTKRRALIPTRSKFALVANCVELQKREIAGEVGDVVLLGATSVESSNLFVTELRIDDSPECDGTSTICEVELISKQLARLRSFHPVLSDSGTQNCTAL